MIKNKKILVTGGAGFIGLHTVDALIKRGAKVVIVDNLVTGKKENLNPKANFISQISPPRELKRFLKKKNQKLCTISLLMC